MECGNECITYTKNNQIENCRLQFKEFDWNNATFVEIKSSHQDETIIVNEFQ